MFLEMIILLSAIPVGYLIAYLTPEELKQGKKYFKLIIIASFLVGIWFYLIGYSYITLTCVFIIIVTFISLIKNKKDIKK